MKFRNLSFRHLICTRRYSTTTPCPKIQAIFDNPNPKKNLLGLSKEELFKELGPLFNQEEYRIRQLWHWIYQRRVTDFSQMTNFNKTLQQKLDEKYKVDYGKVDKLQISKTDNTRKYLIEWNGSKVECMLFGGLS